MVHTQCYRTNKKMIGMIWVCPKMQKTTPCDMLYIFVRMIKVINQWNPVSFFDPYIPLFLRGSMFMKPRVIHFEEHLKKIWELTTCGCKL